MLKTTSIYEIDKHWKEHLALPLKTSPGNNMMFFLHFLNLPSEVTLALTRAVKFNRLTSSFQDLVQQAKECASRLGSCIKMVKVMLPPSKG